MPAIPQTPGSVPNQDQPLLVWVPNVGWVAAQGGTQTADTAGNVSAPVATTASGGGGGGAVTVADGADVTQGTTTDASSTNTLVGLTKAVKANTSNIPAAGQAAMAASSPVVIASNQSAVPVSAASLPLPSGASTAAKQPALGAAGTASTDVISVQGIASMTALKTDGSGVTQPVSGTVTANAGTNLNTSTLALESGGHLANIDSHTPALGQATMANSVPVTVSSNQSSVPTLDTNSAALLAAMQVLNPSRTFVTASAISTAGGAQTATLAATSGKTTYITGFTVVSGAVAAEVEGNVTLTGVITGTLNFRLIETVSSGGVINVPFVTAMPASATNTTIVVNVPAIGSGAIVTISAYGYQQ